MFVVFYAVKVVCVCVFMETWDVCMLVCLFICMYVCMYVCMHVFCFEN